VKVNPPTSSRTGPVRRHPRRIAVRSSLGGHPLGVECRACCHRALVPSAVLRRQSGIDVMTPVKRARLRCQCGSTKWRATIFDKQDDTAAWQGAPGPTFG
jgi:hypothetical protein